MMMSLLILTLTSCGKAPEATKLSHTGDETYELMVGSISARSEVKEGESYYITTSRLRVRSSDEIINTKENNNIVGHLNINDQVKVINNGNDLRDNLVEVEIISTKSKIKDSDSYYVSYQYLDSKKSKIKERAKSSKYYIVQNLATERLRVYKRQCMDGSCPSKMIFETEMVIGERTKKGGTLTSVGSFQILAWKKFYQDYAGKYPSWWRDSYPVPPEAGGSALKWFRKKYMPKVNGKRKGEMRGAFGWYTAHVGYMSGGRLRKDPSGQWTHGTIGWGVDKKRYIQKTKKFWINVVSDPRSHGCSRVDNESIAYMHEILPVGTPLIKIYAKEALQDQNLTRYSEKTKKWDYILTKEKKGKAGRNAVLRRGITGRRILEEGTASIDIYPNIIEYTPGEKLSNFRTKTKQTGNVYGIHSKKMKGVFYIDTGMVKNYRHPRDKNIKVSGTKSEIVPSFMQL